MTRLRSNAGTPIKVLQIRNLSSLELSGDIEEEPLQFDSDAPFVLREGQVVVSLRGLPIKASVVTEAQRGFVAGSNLAVLTPERESLDAYYLAGLFSTRYLNDSLRAFVGGTTIPSLSIRVLRGFEIPVPPLEQQLVFAEAFRSLDRYQQLTRKLTELRVNRLEAQLATSLGNYHGH